MAFWLTCAEFAGYEGVGGKSDGSREFILSAPSSDSMNKFVSLSICRKDEIKMFGASPWDETMWWWILTSRDGAVAREWKKSEDYS